jgi:uncharacterized damage-inducible protein DinB
VLVQHYLAGISELRAAVEGLSREEWRARPVPGKWSILEVVCHLVDCEQFQADRLKRAISLERPLLIGIDPTGYPEALDYQGADPELALLMFEVTRRHTAAMLQRVADAAWTRTAVHTEGGLLTVRELLMHPIRHLQNHLFFIHEKRRCFPGQQN